MEKSRILVVEDEELFRESLRDYFEPGFEVLLAKDGPEGLMLARDFHPQVILLDLRLPGLMGMNVLRVLKMFPETVRIPVVVVSAVSDSDSLMDAVALGASDYLIKPCSLAEIQKTLRRYV